MLEIATLAGGCFWCTEAVFQRLKGVLSVESGYTGGNPPAGGENPTYEHVCSGKTGHAEAVQITFDSEIISFEKLLEVFWHLHDPTTLNKQGADIGTQYRSAIFYHTEKQKIQALYSKEVNENAGIWKDKFVTEIVPFTNFYPAEIIHKDYYNRNQTEGYCQFVIDPKITKLYKEFKNEMK